MLAKTIKTEGVKGQSLRLMFQDEARFGRITDPRSCWAPYPIRPVVKASLVREYVYAYAAVSPLQGDLDWKICAKMNTECMGEFLNQIGKRYTDDFIIMILDGASSHRAKNLVIPENIRLIPLPPYSPELNPVEHIWDELREKEFPNRVFDSLRAVQVQLEAGMKKMSTNNLDVKRLTYWPWIENSLILNTT